MSPVRKTRRRVLTSVVGVLLLAGVALWQFYEFVTFTDTRGVTDVQGGLLHLWLAIGAALVACIGGFLIFSIFLRYDRDDEMHITYPPQHGRGVATPALNAEIGRQVYQKTK